MAAVHGGPASSWEAQAAPEARGSGIMGAALGAALAAAALAALAARARAAREQRRRALAAEKQPPKSAAEGEAADADNGADAEKPSVEIAYCLKCRWGLRAAWMAQEILATFEQDVRSVNLAPSMEGGTYTIKLQPSGEVVWDRRVDGKFPEAKEAKRRLRDMISPGRALGRCLDGKCTT